MRARLSSEHSFVVIRRECHITRPKKQVLQETIQAERATDCGLEKWLWTGDLICTPACTLVFSRMSTASRTLPLRSDAAPGGPCRKAKPNFALRIYVMLAQAPLGRILVNGFQKILGKPESPPNRWLLLKAGPVAAPCVRCVQEVHCTSSFVHPLLVILAGRCSLAHVDHIHYKDYDGSDRTQASSS